MTPARVRKPGIAVVALTGIPVLAAAMLMSGGVARADVAVRNKQADPAGSTSTGVVTPIRSERLLAAAPATDTESPPSADGEQPAPGKTEEYVPQAEDKDRPTDPALLDQQKTEAQLAAQAKAKEGPPFYTKWQFWAITGGVIVGLVAAVWGGTKIVHAANGGDVRPCGMSFTDGCYGQGH